MKPILLHAHIFKNAGTTLDWALRRSFGDGFVEHQQEDLMRSRGVERLAEVVGQQPGLRALSSHHMPAIPPALDGYRFHQIYLLRHPLRRALSAYRFERRQDADTRGARAAKELDLRAYLAWRLQPDVPNVVKNYQVAYLAGCHEPLVSAATSVGHFAAARETLQRLPLVGLVERFDESMVLFESLLAAQFPGLDLAYRRQNQSSAEDAGNLSAVLEAMGEMAGPMVDANALDLALYQQAKVKFDIAIASISGFDDKLMEFRNRCNVL